MFRNGSALLTRLKEESETRHYAEHGSGNTGGKGERDNSYFFLMDVSYS